MSEVDPQQGPIDQTGYLRGWVRSEMHGMRQQMDRIERGQEKTNTKVDRLVVAFMGDLENPEDKPGLVVRVDRLEQWYRSIKWTVALIAGSAGVLVTVVKWIVDSVKGAKP